MSQLKLLIATRNPGKMREYRQLLQETPFELVSLDDLGIAEEVEETGLTFAENATLKATTYGALAGLLTLADDSGLEVDALGGEPGIHSARYGEKSPLTLLHERGEQVAPQEQREQKQSDQDRVDLLLRNLEGVPWERRTARFRCIIAIATPPSPTRQAEEPTSGPPFVKGGRGNFALQDRTRKNLALVVGSVAGMIQYESAGHEGFGYDPVFYLPSFGLTMAQLCLEEKNRISHRSDAAGKATRLLIGTK